MDQLTSATRQLDESSNTLGYLFGYQLDGGGANLAKIAVYVPASAVVDPNLAADEEEEAQTGVDPFDDLSAALAIANVQAKALKTAWLAAYDATVEFLTKDDDRFLGNITL